MDTGIYEKALSLKVEEHNLTIKEYLAKLLLTLWKEEESFSGKRPFGNSGWQQDIYRPLVKEKLIKGKLDEDGYIEKFDEKKANELVLNLIKYVIGV